MSRGQGALRPPHQVTRVRGDPTCQAASPAQPGAEGMVKSSPAVSNHAFPNVQVQRQAAVNAVHLKKPCVLPTNVFRTDGGYREFVHLNKVKQ